MDIDNIPSSLILDGVIVEQNNPAYSIVLCNKAAKKVNATLAKERDHSSFIDFFNMWTPFSTVQFTFLAASLFVLIHLFDSTDSFD